MTGVWAGSGYRYERLIVVEYSMQAEETQHGDDDHDEADDIDDVVHGSIPFRSGGESVILETDRGGGCSAMTDRRPI